MQNYTTEYMQKFRTKFQETIRSKDLPSQFNTVPSQMTINEIVDTKLQVFTDFVKPTFKVELLRIFTGNDKKSKELNPQPQRKNLNVKVARLAESENKIFVMQQPFIPQSRTVDLRVKTLPRNKEQLQRVFDKEKSVFKYWIPDTDRSL